MSGVGRIFLSAEERAQARRGCRIQAIQLVRERKQCSLKEAAAAVEKYLKRRGK